MFTFLAPKILLLLFVKVKTNPVGESTVYIPNLGEVIGLIQQYDDSDSTYHQYLGIPYGNSTRFEQSQPTGLWQYPHNGRVEGKVCPQPLDTVIYPSNVSEDCLELSITTPQDPNASNEEPRAVCVFIHGGIFFIGSSERNWYDPQFLVSNNIIVVQPNYRLGAFGWISDGSIITKNNALKDVRLALEWVHDNIAAFGGDPNRVTLYGESAGAAIVSTLWLSTNPKITKLFRSVFMQSGVAISPWVIQKRPKLAFDNVLCKTRCAFTVNLPIEEQVDCLRRLSTDELNVSDLATFGLNDVLFVGVLNGLNSAVLLEDASDPEAIVVTNPLEQLQSGDFRTDAALMISITSQEIFSFAAVTDVVRTKENWQIVPLGMDATDPDLVGKLIKEHYAGSELGWTLESDEGVYIQFLSDLTMNYPSRHFIELIHPYFPSSVPIYALQFSYVSLMGRFNDLVSQVGHGDDLFYTWKMEAISKEDEVSFLYPAETFTKRQQFNEMISNFVKYRDPTPTRTQFLENTIWPPVTDLNTFDYLNFDHCLTVKNRLKDTNYAFWTYLYTTYGNGKVSM